MEEDDLISKTRRKKQMAELQSVGAALVELSPEQLARIDMPESLRDAIEDARRFTRHEARRRQLQYIGRIMRDIDAGPVVEQLAAVTAPSKRQTALFHVAERWRQELLADPDDARSLREGIPGSGPAAHPRAGRGCARGEARFAPAAQISGALPRALRDRAGPRAPPSMSPASHDPVRIGLVATSDRASQGVYRDEGIPALEQWLGGALLNPVEFESRLIPDEQPVIEATLRELVDERACHLVVTTGGTGPAARDVTPEATLAVADRVMPGFGEQMRRISLEFVPTAILSRQVAVIRRGALILNLPGQPKSIRETLEGLKSPEGKTIVAGIFAAVPYCIDLIGGPYLETREEVVKAFRPKSAIRPPRS